MTGMLLNNTAYYFGINNELSYTFDFLIGNSIVTTFLIYLCSYIFNFCIWHRLIITANLINPFSEEAAYLAGFVGQRMYPKAKHFLCKCHCE